MKTMRWKGLRLLFVAIGVVALTACGSSTDEDHTNGHSDHGQQQGAESDVEATLKVDVTVEPEPVQAGEETAVRAAIIQNGEAVEDAHVVRFEIGPEGASEDEREKVETALVDGVYQGMYTFPEAGDYQVMVHVTARGSHMMDAVEVSVP
ncbi:FixH family protein [Desmospora profundinema]|uniref:YtkA-like domain-containing protein n=1 Tax=Desmospora profundinema TaxID=1571184 RepID=A0ABU1IMG1_9BACL|nr:FixH family protein [Desmospora profundinema]MDR6225977.1 hypothetical protein [Desmospora profundinema]